MKNIAIFVFFFSSFLLTAGGHLYRLDGYTMFLFTKSLVHGRLDIPDKSAFVVEGLNGKYYSVLETGTSIVGIPFYLAGDYLNKVFNLDFLDQMMYSFMNCFFAGLLCVLFFNFCRELDFSGKASLSLMFILAFGTFVWTYSQLDGYGIISALILLGILYLLHGYKKCEKMHYFTAASIVYAFSIFFRISFLILFPVFLFYLYNNKMSVLQNFKTYLKFLYPLLISAFVLLLFNYFRFGSFMFDPRVFHGKWFYLPEVFSGLAGQVFSFGKSIVIYNPVILAIFFDIKKIIKNRTGLFFILIPCYFIFVHSFFINWPGDWGWGPRYLLPVVPCLLLCLGMIYRKILKHKIIFGFIVISSFYITLSSVVVNPL